MLMMLLRLSVCLSVCDVDVVGTGAMIELDRRTGAIEVNGDEDKVGGWSNQTKHYHLIYKSFYPSRSPLS